MKKQIVKTLLGIAVCMGSQTVMAQAKSFTYAGVQVGKSFEICPLMRNCEILKVQSFKRNNSMVELTVKSSKHKQPYKVTVQCSVYSPMVRIGKADFEKIPLNDEIGPSAVMIAPTEIYLKTCHNKGFEHYDSVVRQYGYSSYE